MVKIVDGIRYVAVVRDEILARLGSTPKELKLEIPYFGQFEKKWQDSGAKNEDEYDFWKWNICGMACLKMILKYWTGKEYKTVDLAKKCASYRGYFADQPKDINGHVIVPGLFYKAFCRYVKAEFDIEALPTNILTISRMKWELVRGNLIVVSINKEKHLVILAGFDGNKLFLHDPSKLGKRTVTEKEFQKIYNGRGYVFFAPKTATTA